ISGGAKSSLLASTAREAKTSVSDCSLLLLRVASMATPFTRTTSSCQRLPVSHSTLPPADGTLSRRRRRRRKNRHGSNSVQQQRNDLKRPTTKQTYAAVFASTRQGRDIEEYIGRFSEMIFRIEDMGELDPISN
ncbi:TPA: hypothetical protein N0F65_011137, partial [Lagenidium giganteum]